MSKKLTLKEQLENSKRNEVYYNKELLECRSRINKFEEGEEKRKRDSMFEVQNTLDFNRILVEIIRWQINPQTTIKPINPKNRDFIN